MSDDKEGDFIVCRGVRYYPADIHTMREMTAARDSRIAELEAENKWLLEIIRDTYAMGFYAVDNDSGLTHRDVSCRAESVLGYEP